MQTSPHALLDNAYDSLRGTYFDERFDLFTDQFLWEYMYGDNFLILRSKSRLDKVGLFSVSMMTYENEGIPGYVIGVHFFTQGASTQGNVPFAESYVRSLFPTNEGNVEKALVDLLKFISLWRKDRVTCALHEFSPYFANAESK